LTRDRKELVLDVVQLRRPLHAAIQALGQLPWDCDEELVLLGPFDALRVMSRYLSGEMTSKDVDDWANALEARDDVGVEDGARDLLEDFIFTMANPLLTEPLTPQAASVWQARLEDSDLSYEPRE
jgi:hypothetical protein